MLRVAALNRFLWVAGLTMLACGCSPNVKLEDLQSGATGAIVAIPAAAQALVPKAIKPPVGSATEVYTRVARGALTCWMGGLGGMRDTHLFQADAKPRSEGGAAQIDIHERIADKPNIPGRRVFAVSITPLGEGASVASENLGLPAEKGDAMRADVDRWAAAEEGCLAEPITEGWTPPEAETSISAVKPKT
ncbi:MAG: hypothetical protein APF80_15475 [Alphaproteobacteria bacterium BRH_c36]|nr:MAG: hypothetical protein APF80_15475 [Alphaproteobacteria bacterium BRH_c36]